MNNRHPYVPAIIIFALGAVLSVFMLVALLKVEQTREQAVFDARVRSAQGRFKERIDLSIAALESIEGLYAATGRIDHRSFHEFMAHIMLHLNGVHALNAIPRVSQQQRAAFELAARADGYPGFHFTELSADRRSVPAGIRNEYFPIYYVEPYARNAAPLGYDIASNPARRTVIEKARDTGEVQVTGRVTLMQDRGVQNGFLILLPVYRIGVPHDTVANRRRNFYGFALGTYRIDELVGAVMNPDSSNGIEIKVYDGSALSEPMYDGTRYNSKHAPRSLISRIQFITPRFSKTTGLHVGGHKWALSFSSTPAFNASVRSSVPWVSFLGGILFTALLTAYAFAHIKRARHFEALNLELRQENAKRRRAEDELQSSEEELKTVRTILDGVRSGVFIIDCETHEIVDANTAALEMIGAPRDAVIGSVCHKFVCPAEQGQCPITDLGQTVDNSERMLIRADGALCPIFKTISHINLSGRKYLLESFVDIREMKQSQDRLRENERFLETVLDGIQDGIAVIDLDMNLLRTNSVAERNFSDCMPLVGKKCFEVFHESTKPCDMCLSLRAIKEGKRLSTVKPRTMPDGTTKWLEFSASPIVDDDGKTKACVHHIRDITEKRAYDERLFHMAHHDSLTDLPNRLEFGAALRNRLARAKQEGCNLAVLFVDLDRFKSINDTLGHRLGDELLREISVRVKSTLRQCDIIARMGGDEFTIILDEIGSKEEAEVIAGRILDALSRPIVIHGHEIFATASIGISMYPNDAEEAEDLVKNADMAMYRAKEDGRNNYQFYIRSVDSLLLSRVDMQNDLRKAIQRRELLVHYQPQFDLATNSIRGVEALVRWQHPDFGMVMPGKFIPLAEETGLIRPITEFVLMTACKQAKAWVDKWPLRVEVSVNISAHELHQQSLLAMVKRALEETQLDPHRLILEITESTLAKKPQSAVETIESLKYLGVRVAIDDFGTRYASLSLLKQFPVDCLKIDRCFVKNIGENLDDAIIVETVITMAHKLGLMVVAEGIETQRQFDALKALGCDGLQGYLISRPVPAHECYDAFFADDQAA